MIYDIVISDQAEIDLRGIFEYIAFELQAPENASGQLDRLEACIMDLDHMPKRYRQYELEPWKSRGLRVAPVIGTMEKSRATRSASRQLSCSIYSG